MSLSKSSLLFSLAALLMPLSAHPAHGSFPMSQPVPTLTESTAIPQPDPDQRVGNNSRPLRLSQVKAQTDPTWKAGTVTLFTIDTEEGGHSYPVRSVVFSPDGRYLASGSADRAVKIWDLHTRTLERVLPRHSAQILSISFSPDGQLLASGALDGTVRLWNWRRGELIETYTGHSERITAVAFSPGGRYLATGSGDKIIRLWNVETQQLWRTFKTQQAIESIAFSPDRRTLASSGLGMFVELWDWRTGKLMRSLGRYSSAIYAIAFSPNGKTLAFSPNSLSPRAPRPKDQGPRNTVNLWSLQGQLVGQPFAGHKDYISAIVFSPTGRTLITGSWDNTVRIWNVRTGRLIRGFLQNGQRILSLAFSPDGQAFALGSGDSTIKIFASVGSPYGFVKGLEAK